MNAMCMQNKANELSALTYSLIKLQWLSNINTHVSLPSQRCHIASQFCPYSPLPFAITMALCKCGRLMQRMVLHNRIISSNYSTYSPSCAVVQCAPSVECIFFAFRLPPNQCGLNSSFALMCTDSDSWLICSFSRTKLKNS